jgi:hypothetical protein
LAALRAGAPAVRMDFLFLERPLDLVGFEYGLEEQAHLESVLDLALTGIREGRFTADCAGGCRGCGVETLCGALTPALARP